MNIYNPENIECKPHQCQLISNDLEIKINTQSRFFEIRFNILIFPPFFTSPPNYYHTILRLFITGIQAIFRGAPFFILIKYIFNHTWFYKYLEFYLKRVWLWRINGSYSQEMKALLGIQIFWKYRAICAPQLWALNLCWGVGFQKVIGIIRKNCGEMIYLRTNCLQSPSTSNKDLYFIYVIGSIKIIHATSLIVKQLLLNKPQLI